ncbi:hypothetical protein NSK11_contig00345-0001, partial [Nocardia seriolae]
MTTYFVKRKDRYQIRWQIFAYHEIFRPAS